MANKAIRIVSWNIQKFGAAKLADKNFLDYVAEVILDCEADFVGIMEIVGWCGQDIKNQLVAILTNKGPGAWAGEESEMTPSRPHEQYIFLWQTNLVTMNEQRLYRVIGDSAFSQFFTATKWSQKQQDDFWQALLDKNYLEDDYMMTDSVCDALKAKPTSLDLTPTVKLTDAEKKNIVRILTADASLGFPHKGSRPPYIGKTALEATPAPVPCLIVLFHAPGPTGMWPMTACSMLGLMNDVIGATKGVVMGDFNVTQVEAGSQYVHFRWSNGALQKVVDPKTKNTLTSTPFQRLTGPDLVNKNVPPPDVKCAKYKKVFDNTPTSLTNKPVVNDTVVATNKTINDLKRSEYDNFFVQGFLDAAILQSEVLEVIDQLVPKTVNKVTKSTTKTPYSLTLATLAAKVFNTWWDEQNKRGIKKPDIINPKKDKNPITKIPNDKPTSLRQAHYIYRYAISDHQPIFIELEYA